MRIERVFSEKKSRLQKYFGKQQQATDEIYALQVTPKADEQHMLLQSTLVVNWIGKKHYDFVRFFREKNEYFGRQKAAAVLFCEAAAADASCFRRSLPFFKKGGGVIQCVR